MVDVLYVLLLLGLFLLTAGFVTVCDRMLGSDEEALADTPPSAAEEERRLAA
jgi:hypothetical protein